MTDNTAPQAFAESVPELATMKTLGFSDRAVATLVLAEAIALCVGGGTVGVGIAFLLEPALNANLGAMIGSFDMSGQGARFRAGSGCLAGTGSWRLPGGGCKASHDRRCVKGALDMFRQTINITTMNLRSILSRKGSSSIIVVGIAGVVAVVVGLLSMSEGIESALKETSHPDRVLVMRSGTQDEITGWLSAAEVNVLKGIDGIRSVSGELVVVVDLVTRETGKPGVAVALAVSKLRLWKFDRN